MTSETLAQRIQEYLKENLYLAHQRNSCEKNSQLASYKINPLTVRYLSKTLDGDFTAAGVAKALYYPRVLGTSLVTTFGTTIQKMFIELNIAEASLLAGMDIQFDDHIDGQLKYCQLKAGPNTINADDVNPIKSKFTKIRNRARANGQRLNNNDMIVGVIYGKREALSRHYLNIDEDYPVHIGQELWQRITGFHDIYLKLEERINSLIDNMTLQYPANSNEKQAPNYFEKGLAQLTEDIRKSEMFNFD